MTNRDGRLLRGGFVLPMALVMMLVAGLIVGGVVSYVVQAQRLAQIALVKDRCRMAAQSAIEEAKMDIHRGFTAYIAENFSTIKIAPGKAKAFNWFNPENVSADRRSVGNPSPARIFDGKAYPLAVNGCDVWVGIGQGVVHEDDAADAVLPVVATAVCVLPNGLRVSATIQECIVFQIGQSPVFDNAYFVNNYGWMSGNFTINGEFRANGNVSLTGGAVVNGFVYAAPNAEVGARGEVTLSSASIKNQSGYRSSSTTTTRSRYDTGNLDEMGSYDAARTTGSIVKPTYNADGTVRSGSVTESSGAAIVQEKADPVEMPFVSDLAPYVDYARDSGGTLDYPAVSYTGSDGKVHTTPAGRINAYRSMSEAGPAGDASLADAGSLLLVGTQSNPIRLNGPVVVAGDVIIKGYVSGQGTIYAGRNVHIIGDIKYVNAPKWTHTTSGDAARQEQAANETKDMLGLVAKGNVVVGDSTSASIAQNVNSGKILSYACDENDAAIGYQSKFNGRYTDTERVSGLSGTLAARAPGGYDSASAQFGKVRSETVTLETTHTETRTTRKQVITGYDWWGRPQYGWQNVTETVEVPDTEVRLMTKYDRKYYETICDDQIVKSLRGTIATIDAVMYNNHGVFGSLDANFMINGALVCRDEGLTANGGTFNWDMRLRRKKGSAVVEKMGLPKGSGEPYVAEWIEVPDEMNPTYPHVGAGGGK